MIVFLFSDLQASLDEPTQMLIMHRTEPSRIQGLALQLADKVNSLVDQNERIWEYKQMGSFGGAHQNQNQRQGYSGRNRNAEDGQQQREGGYHRRGRRGDGGGRGDRNKENHDGEAHEDHGQQNRRYNRDNRRGQYNRGQQNRVEQ